MSKISSVVVSGLVNRRSYGVYARAVNVHVSSAAAGRTTDGAVDGAGTATKKEVFWMRDPKTGCWIPENQFQEVDAVELRNRLLRYK
ncbi:unnamed protein product [Urochloa humidicola]